ncbi:MAG TPA: flippase-like domain-containing protein [Saprospiraceae bacterium]|nr:flippase-like domain-containing protein [Saprospiraceae bacterium]
MKKENSFRKLTKIVRSKPAKALFFIFFLWVLYRQLDAHGDWAEMMAEFKDHLGESPVWLFLLALMLTWVNYHAETLKWMVLTRPFQKISFKTAIMAVYAGISLGMVSPARIGEYGGRMLGLTPANRAKSVWALSFGAFLQKVVIFWLGVGVLVTPGFGGELLRQSENPYLDSEYFLPILIFVGVLLLVALVFYDPIIRHILRKQSWLGKKIYQGYFKYEWRDTWPALGLTAMRYLVYSVQLYLLNRFFGLPDDASLQFSIIFVTYWVQSFFPMPAALGLLIKSEIALFLWSAYGVNEISVLSGTFFLWIINGVLPSLIGLLFLDKILDNKTKGDV